MRLLLVFLASLWLAVGWAPVAAAQTGDEEVRASPAEAARFRLDLRGGLGVRRDTLTTAATRIAASGTAVSDLVLDGAWFARRASIGVAGRLELDHFGLRGDDGGAAVPATGLEAMLALAGRLNPNGGPFLVEGQLGYGFLRAPVAGLPAADGSLSSSADGVTAHGPALGLIVALAPSDALTFEVAGRVLPVTFGGRYHDTPMDMRRLAAGLGASAGRVSVGDFRLSALISYELASTTAEAPGLEMKQLRHQIAIGLRATPKPAPAPARAVVVPIVAPVRGRIRGVVRLQGSPGAPAAGVVVAVQAGPRTTTSADGAFMLGDLDPGLVQVSLARADLVPATEVVSVPPGGEVTVQLTVRPAQAPAPAVVIGLVRSETGTPVAARVRLLEPALTVDADARGRFRFEVPAGRYTLTIEAPGYATQRKTVRAGAGEQNIYNVDLQAER